MGRAFVAAALVAAGVSGASGAAAQEFKGAEIGAEVLAFNDDEEITTTTYRAGVELGLWGGFGAALDFNAYDFGESDGGRNITVHLLYDAFDVATVGAFASRDSSDDAEATTFGIEAGRSFGSFGGEVYLGAVDDEGEDFRLLGFDGAYDVSRRLSLTGSAMALVGDAGNLSRAAVGAEFRWGDAGPILYGELGRLSVEDETSDLGADSTFMGLGARIALGENRGTTFESRGLFEFLSGL